MKNLTGLVLLGAFAIGSATLLVGAQGKQARVTQLVQDVRLLTSRSGSRPANLNDTVTENTAVRTGTDSRAELTFADQTLARVGANTVFSFGDGAKDFDLNSGAMLLAAPKSSGTLHVNTAGATAAISGFTALFESHHKGWSKFIILEGTACVKHSRRRGEDCIVLHGGEMLLLDPNGRFTDKKKVDVEKVVATAGLIKKMHTLPKWSLDAIHNVIDTQSGNPPEGGYFDPTNVDKRDQKQNQPMPQPHMHQPPPPPPPSF
jgi:hypothetical protein